jgi:Protein of unknown function (DUF1269)
MGNGALAIGPKLPRPSSTLPNRKSSAAQRFRQLVAGATDAPGAIASRAPVHFPAGGTGGAAIGALVGHVHSGIPRSDLKAIADLLDASEAALIVVYEAKLADQVKTNLKAVKQIVRQMVDVKADQIADEMRQAHAA